MSDITLGQFYNAIAQGAREATLEALKGKDFATQTTLAQVKQVLDTLNGSVSTSAGQADIQQAIAALASIVAKESTLGQAKSVLDAISGKVATDQGVGLVASAVEALAQIAATENTLSQAVQKLESIVSSLQNTLTVDGKVELKGSVAQVLDYERAAGFGQRMYYGQQFAHVLGLAGAVPIVGKTVTIWFHNLSDYSTRSGVRLHWFFGGTVHDGIPVMDFGDVPAGSVLGLRIGGSAPDNDQIIHVPRFGGDGVVFSVDISSLATGNVRTVILEESSYA